MGIFNRKKKEESGLEPFQQRVVDEHNELATKIISLDKFIKSSDIFKGLSRLERRELSDQLKHMSEYLNILYKRINRF